MLYLSYGSYNHPEGEVTVRFRQRPLLSDVGLRIGDTHTWDISGVLQGSSVGDLTTKINALVAAYSRNGENIGLFETGGIPTAHYLNSNASQSGVKIISGPDFPDSSGGEYANKRSYEISVEADFVTSGVSNIVSWSETLSFSGGGPLEVYVTVLRGPPQKQRLAQTTPYRVIQQGNAVGLLRAPSIPKPLFPGAQMRLPEITETTPEFKDGKVQNFAISWSYEFQSPTPLIGHPTRTF